MSLWTGVDDEHRRSTNQSDEIQQTCLLRDLRFAAMLAMNRVTGLFGLVKFDLATGPSQSRGAGQAMK